MFGLGGVFIQLSSNSLNIVFLNRRKLSMPFVCLKLAETERLVLYQKPRVLKNSLFKT